MRSEQKWGLRAPRNLPSPSQLARLVPKPGEGPCQVVTCSRIFNKGCKSLLLFPSCVLPGSSYGRAKFNETYLLGYSQLLGEGNGTPLQYSCLENPMDGGAWWAAVHGVAKSRTRLSGFTFTFHFHALEKEMATHSSVLAWRIPGTGEPGGLPSMGSHRVGHD